MKFKSSSKYLIPEGYIVFSWIFGWKHWCWRKGTVYSTQNFWTKKGAIKNAQKHAEKNN